MQLNIMYILHIVSDRPCPREFVRWPGISRPGKALRPVGTQIFPNIPSLRNLP